MVFGRSQALYAQHSRDSQTAVKRAVPLSYGVYAEQLLDTALRGCAKGRLWRMCRREVLVPNLIGSSRFTGRMGLKALEIFNDWARALRTGEVRARPSDISPLVNHGKGKARQSRCFVALMTYDGLLSTFLHVQLLWRLRIRSTLPSCPSSWAHW